MSTVGAGRAMTLRLPGPRPTVDRVAAPRNQRHPAHGSGHWGDGVVVAPTGPPTDSPTDAPFDLPTGAPAAELFQRGLRLGPPSDMHPTARAHPTVRPSLCGPCRLAAFCRERDGGCSRREHFQPSSPANSMPRARRPALLGASRSADALLVCVRVRTRPAHLLLRSRPSAQSGRSSDPPADRSAARLPGRPGSGAADGAADRPAESTPRCFGGGPPAGRPTTQLGALRRAPGAAHRRCSEAPIITDAAHSHSARSGHRPVR